jgi:flavin-dependent dehydrogenase
VTESFDAVIVGGRVAGCGLAIRMARSGRSVLAIEKSPYGSDTLSSHGFGGMAMGQLTKLGVIDDVTALDAPRLKDFRIDFNGMAMPMPVMNEFGFTLSIRRTTLDPILVDHARKAGAEVRHGVTARGLLFEGDRVVGLTIEDEDGVIEDVHARIVVGADGRHSKVAEWVDAPIYERVTTPSCATYAYYEGFVPPQSGWCIQFACGDGIDSLAAPSDGGVTAILVIYPKDRYEEAKRGGIERFEYDARSIPVLGDQLREAELVSRLRPAGERELECFFRKPYGPGWALVGDAGYKEHPAAGRGIGNGLRCAELLHRYVEQAWSEGKEGEAHLGQYHRLRDEHFVVSSQFSLMQASVNPMATLPMAQIASTAAKLGQLDAATTTD